MRAYAAEKSAIAELVRDLDEGAAATVVPACPSWTVHDVVAHLVGGCQSQAEDTSPPEPESDIMKVLVGWNEPERVAARDRWTGAMVEERRLVPIPELLEEWDRWERAAVIKVNSGGLSAMRIPALVTDLVIHGQDLRATLGSPGDTPREPAHLAMNSLLFMLDLRISAVELPPLRVEDDAGRVLSGKTAASPVLTGTRHELLRVLGGRRTSEQITVMLTGEEAGRYVPIIPLYDPPAKPLDE